jgi:hypothetical protein
VEIADAYVFQKDGRVIELFASRKSADPLQTRRLADILQGLFGKPRRRPWWV